MVQHSVWSQQLGSGVAQETFKGQAGSRMPQPQSHSWSRYQLGSQVQSTGTDSQIVVQSGSLQSAKPSRSSSRWLSHRSAGPPQVWSKAQSVSAQSMSPSRS